VPCNSRIGCLQLSITEAILCQMDFTITVAGEAKTAAVQYVSCTASPSSGPLGILPACKTELSRTSASPTLLRGGDR
jgi:hypothetical protein